MSNYKLTPSSNGSYDLTRVYDDDNDYDDHKWHCKQCGRAYYFEAAAEEERLKDTYGFKYQETSEYKRFLANKKGFCSTYCQKSYPLSKQKADERNEVLLPILFCALFFYFIVYLGTVIDFGHFYNPLLLFKIIYGG